MLTNFWCFFNKHFGCISFRSSFFAFETLLGKTKNTPKTSLFTIWCLGGTVLYHETRRIISSWTLIRRPMTLENIDDVDGRTDGRIDGWMDGWMDGWRDGWMDGCMDVWM